MTVEQWFWMMNWCKEHRLPPSDSKVWNVAKEEYLKQTSSARLFRVTTQLCDGRQACVKRTFSDSWAQFTRLHGEALEGTDARKRMK